MSVKGKYFKMTARQPSFCCTACRSIWGGAVQPRFKDNCSLLLFLFLLVVFFFSLELCKPLSLCNLSLWRELNACLRAFTWFLHQVISRMQSGKAKEE